MLRCILFLIKLSVVAACTCTAKTNGTDKPLMWINDTRGEEICLCCQITETKNPTTVKKDDNEFCKISPKSPTSSNNRHECKLQTSNNMVIVILKEPSSYGKNTSWICESHFKESEPVIWPAKPIKTRPSTSENDVKAITTTLVSKNDVKAITTTLVSGDQLISTTDDQPTSASDHWNTAGLTIVSRNLTTETAQYFTTKVKMIGTGIIATCFALLLVVVPIFCYRMKHHRKPVSDPETPPVDTPGGEDEATRNDQGNEGQSVVDSLDDTTIVSVMDLTGYTPLGMTDAKLSRSTAFTQRDRIFLHNISRQLQIIIDREGIDRRKWRPDVEAVKVKAIEKVYNDDDEPIYGASGQSTAVKTFVGIPIDQPSVPTGAREFKNSVNAPTSDRRLHEMKIKPRRRLPLPRFEETSPNCYYAIAGGHGMATPISEDCTST